MDKDLDKLFENNKNISRVGFTRCFNCGKCVWLYFQLGTEINWDELQKLIQQDRTIDPLIKKMDDQHIVLNTCTVQNMQQNINELSRAITEKTDDDNNLKGRNIGAYEITNTNDLIFLSQLGNNIFIHLIEKGQWKPNKKERTNPNATNNRTTRRAEQSSGNPS